MGGERLEAEWVRAWCTRAGADLAESMRSFQARHGFPPGRNVIACATEESHRDTDALVELTPIPSDLTTLYWVVAEISLPDVDAGYFVHPPSMVAGHFREYGPIRIDGEEPALVFASDGGGHLFALAGSRRVWRSATPSHSARFDLAAPGLDEFLDTLAHRIADRP
ncbi:hypothetical protein ACFO4E_00445 [Nocardiopsis mangrovi]|uniref:SMI1/KNR4 family protein n=1 Tax=Nocardiopsis mangrovi TaxID=1179818 RepID=A0ABV9DQ34_9ACTN